MTVFWFVRRSVSHPLFYCAWPCSDWSVGLSRIHFSIVDDRFLIDPYVGLASIVHLSITVFWLVLRSVSSPMFYSAWQCSDWSVGRSRIHCSIVHDRVLIGPYVGLASIVLLSMTVFSLIRMSVSPPLFTCRWPCSDWSIGRSRLHCSIAHDRVLIGPEVFSSSPLFYCRCPCSNWSVGRSHLHCSHVDERVLTEQ